MDTQLVPPTSYFIKEWEEAGSSLSSALEKYLLLGENLGSRVLLDDTHPIQLIARIDSALQTRHIVLNRQLGQAHSRLAQTRNFLSSQSYGLPREILAEIFLCVVYSPPKQNSLYSAPMKRTLFHMFRNLYSLQLVCRLWRDTIISQGSLWCIAPVYCTDIPTWRYKRGPSLSLERSKENLHLAAVMDVDPVNVRFTIPDISRFRKINLHTRSPLAISALLKDLLQSALVPNLSELSLHQERAPGWSIRQSFPPVPSRNYFGLKAFRKLLKNLTILRIRGAQFSWNRMVFSDHLVELRLQDVGLGPDSEFIEFLNKLSLASGLRDLKLISIQTCHDATSLTLPAPGDQAAFPSLESLYVEDLTFNTLMTALYQIAPGSHQLTIHLTERYIELDEFGSETYLEFVCTHFGDISVDTLVLCGGLDGEGWLSPSDIHELLFSMPELKTLKMNRWKFHEAEWLALIPSEEDEEYGDDYFPNLECIELTRVRITDEEYLEDVVVNHSIERMVLGGRIDTSAGESEDFNPLQGNEPIIHWLRDEVPNFTLADHTTQSPEFFSSVWPLW